MLKKNITIEKKPLAILADRLKALEAFGWGINGCDVICGTGIFKGLVIKVMFVSLATARESTSF